MFIITLNNCNHSLYTIYNTNYLDYTKENMLLILLSSEKKEKNIPYIINHFIKTIPELCKVKKFRPNFFKNFSSNNLIPKSITSRLSKSVEILLEDDIEEFNYKIKTKSTITKTDILILILMILISLIVNRYIKKKYI